MNDTKFASVSSVGEELSVSWFTEKGIDEVLFCREFLQKHPMVCINDCFVGLDGRIEKHEVKKLIYDELCPYIRRGISRTTDQLWAALTLEAYSDPLPPDVSRIHVANGTYYPLSGIFTEEKVICYNRLPVSFDREAPVPSRWLSFLDELLYPEDILTLQEFMGYCLIPTNKAQKMLLMIGKGGEGKSRVNLVLEALLGDSMNVCSIQKIENNSFARADLRYRLLVVDDDMSLQALPDTNIIKTIVTLEGKMDLERKREQSFQEVLYCRILCLGNGTLSSLFDRSNGFWRRQIILTTKDRDPGRVDDPFLIEKLKEELSGILNWCLEGLDRLLLNDFRFTLSERTEGNLEQAKTEGNNIIPFMQSVGYFRLDESAHAASKAVYDAYSQWCGDNAEKPVAARTLTAYLISAQNEYGIRYTTDIPAEGGRHVRGFQGINVMVRPSY